MDTRLNLAVMAINDHAKRACKAWENNDLPQIASSADSMGNACEMLCSLMLDTPEKWGNVITTISELHSGDPVSRLAIQMLTFTADSVLAVKNRTSI